MPKNQPETGQSARLLPFKALAFVAFVCLALAAMEGWREWTARDGDLTNAEIQTLNLAKSLAQHADDTFGLADTILVGLVERMETDGSTLTSLERLNRLLRLRVAEEPRVRGLFVYDEDGKWIASSLDQLPRELNNADREYFRFHQMSPNRGVHLGTPVKSRSGGQWIVTLSRRLQHPDGRFAGVVLATVDATYFSEFFSQFNVGSGGTILLIHVDGTIMARSPQDEAFLGRDLSNTPLLTDLGRMPFGARRYTSSLDGVARISGFKKAMRFPVVVLAAVAREEVLAPWRSEAASRMLAVAGLIGMVGVMGFRLSGQVRKRRDAEAALGRSEGLFRLLAENSGDMVTRIGLDGRRLYLSPASSKLLGYAPEELEGVSVVESMHPDDRPEMAELVEQLRSGTRTEATAAYRTVRKTGEEIWIEASLHVTNDPVTGKLDGVVAVARDITERKQLEAQLVEVARTDGLTGLANRRAFDEALAREWRRAARQQSPISIVMIDVDRFKLYNDEYGHQAGDVALKAVARALAGTVGRPADLVARYGGEEMVIMLPETSSDAAMIVAERARFAVQHLGIRHGPNEPTGVVTVSVGVSTDSPSSAVSPDQLVKAADEALYRAKASGRNRVLRPFFRPRLVPEQPKQIS